MIFYTVLYQRNLVLKYWKVQFQFYLTAVARNVALLSKENSETLNCDGHSYILC